MRDKLFFYTCILCLLSSCVSPFVHDGFSEYAGILVVEGMIMEKGTTIQLSRTMPTNPFAEVDFSDVNHASIHVIDDTNTIIATLSQQTMAGLSIPATYRVNGELSFIPGKKYALDIRLNNKHYRSTFAEPNHTPEIDEVNWKLNEDNSIDIFVSTHGPDNETSYYLWAFEEDWEIKSIVRTALRYEPDLDTDYSCIPCQYDAMLPQNDTDNRWYCWASDYSKRLEVASSAKLTKNVIKNHKIHSFQPDNSRYSYLYSILVKQYKINREAYSYFDVSQRAVDEAGSIFAPQPVDKAGNIQCLTNPDEIVIGYISVSKETTCRIFIPMAELQLNRFQDFANDWICTDNAIMRFMHDIFMTNRDRLDPRGAYHYWAFGHYSGYRPEDYSFAPLFCVDCTFRGGTKTKPDFWPNDHQ